jgi:hypothetical protein
MNLKEIIKKYFKRNKDYIYSDNIVHEMNGVVLTDTQDKIFDFHSDMIKEVKAYCENQGYDQIDKVVFLSSYERDIDEESKIKIKMHGESKIKIIKEDSDYIAVVCICESVSIKNRWQEYV